MLGVGIVDTARCDFGALCAASGLVPLAERMNSVSHPTLLPRYVIPVGVEPVHHAHESRVSRFERSKPALCASLRASAGHANRYHHFPPYCPTYHSSFGRLATSFTLLLDRTRNCGFKSGIVTITYRRQQPLHFPTTCLYIIHLTRWIEIEIAAASQVSSPSLTTPLFYHWVLVCLATPPYRPRFSDIAFWANLLIEDNLFQPLAKLFLFLLGVPHLLSCGPLG
ncbi:hypothetical protein V8E53_000018 [Lactarius tabidus]